MCVFQATAVDHSTKLYPNSPEVMMVQPSVSHDVKPWHSPSHSYADIWTRTTLACETTHALIVYYSVPFADFPTPLFHFVVSFWISKLKRPQNSITWVIEKHLQCQCFLPTFFIKQSPSWDIFTPTFYYSTHFLTLT